MASTSDCATYIDSGLTQWSDHKMHVVALDAELVALDVELVALEAVRMAHEAAAHDGELAGWHSTTVGKVLMAVENVWMALEVPPDAVGAATCPSALVNWTVRPLCPLCWVRTFATDL